MYFTSSEKILPSGSEAPPHENRASNHQWNTCTHQGDIIHAHKVLHTDHVVCRLSRKPAEKPASSVCVVSCPDPIFQSVYNWWSTISAKLYSYWLGKWSTWCNWLFRRSPPLCHHSYYPSRITWDYSPRGCKNSVQSHQQVLRGQHPTRLYECECKELQLPSQLQLQPIQWQVQWHVLDTSSLFIWRGCEGVC